MKSFENVTVDTQANIYFDGRVVSHSVYFTDGSKKTLGIIYPGSYHFSTEAPELMEIIDGSCEIKLDGSAPTKSIPAGESFDIAANSGFSITVKDGVCQYICSFLSA